MPSVATATERFEVVIEIGGLPIRLCASDPSFIRLLEDRYSGFVISRRDVRFEFEIDLAAPGLISQDEEVRVRWDSGRWSLDRGDFHAENIDITPRGTRFDMVTPKEKIAVFSQLIGKVNVYNILAASAACFRRPMECRAPQRRPGPERARRPCRHP